MKYFSSKRYFCVILMNETKVRIKHMKILKIRENFNWIEAASQWFHEKWHISKETYLESMNECIKGCSIPQWYIAVEDNQIVGGLGVILNDFHERKDLYLNICAVYVEQDYRKRGIAGKLLNTVCEDMHTLGVNKLYLVTNNIGFYEKYGFQYLFDIRCEGSEMSRMYHHVYIDIADLWEELAQLEEVEAIALGGSRAGTVYDASSDYDVYLYINKPIAEVKRRDILKRYASVMEIGNHFWEYEDNCVLNNGIPIDILYRNIDDFKKEIASVVDEHHAHNGYTTCMWHNLKNCKIIVDKTKRLTALKEQYNCQYPKELKKNIIDHNMKLLRYGLPSYEGQILKAIKRQDMVSIHHRTTEFLASYFDIIFAMNEQTHPGEKRLMELCLQGCNLLPSNFEKNINALFHCLYEEPNCIQDVLNQIIAELEKIISKS